MNIKSYHIIALFVFLSSCFNTKNKETETSETQNTTMAHNTQKTVQVYTTAKDTELRLTKSGEQTFKEKVQPLETQIAIFVNPEKTFQKYLGIGGAITDASAEVFSKLNAPKQNELLQSLFGENGIGYNIIRTSIHSSDFGLGSHTYIEEGDSSLSTFSIAKDRKKRIPFIKKSIDLIGVDLVFYASPWSPPAFMKTNKNMLQGGKLLPQYRQAWQITT